jgi:hypothetical protein
MSMNEWVWLAGAGLALTLAVLVRVWERWAVKLDKKTQEPEQTVYLPPVSEQQEQVRLQEKLDASDKKIEARGAPSDDEFNAFVRRVLGEPSDKR